MDSGSWRAADRLGAAGGGAARPRWLDAVWFGWWLILPVAIAAAVWWPITRSYFFGDDLQSVYDVVNKPLPELLLLPYGGHLYIVRNAIYRLLYDVFGPSPEAYYCVALVTQLANVALLCALIHALTDSALLACFGGVLWGTAPVAESTINWYSVLGHALATCLLLIVLNGIVRAGRRGAVRNAECILWGVLMLAASTCFGVGIVFAVLVPIAAFLLMPPGQPRRRAVAVLGATAVVVPVLYFTAQRIAAARYGSPNQSMLLAAILQSPLHLVDLVINMVCYGTEQVVLGPLARRVHGTGPVALVAVPVIALAVVAAWRARPSARRSMLACALVMLGAYGIIAMGRVMFYSQLRDLIIRADRYHYSASAMFTVLLCVALAELGARAPSRSLKHGALAAWLLVWIGLLAFAQPRINHYDYARKAAVAALTTIQRFVTEAAPGEDVYIENQQFRGVGPFVLMNPQNFPGWAGLFAVYHATNIVDGRRVFFVEADRHVLAKAQLGVRSAPLLVSPDAVPAERVRRAPAPPPWRPPPAAPPPPAQ